MAGLAAAGGFPERISRSSAAASWSTPCAANDLVDEYRLMIHPIVMGTSKRLFGDASSTARLRLVESKPTSTSVMSATYELAHEA
jgi:dihydrofolate reductase